MNELNITIQITDPSQIKQLMACGATELAESILPERLGITPKLIVMTALDKTNLKLRDDLDDYGFWEDFYPIKPKPKSNST